MVAKNEHHIAKLNGEKYYFTGNLCKHGHISYRYVSSKVCIECNSERNYKVIRTEQAKEYAKQYRNANKQKIFDSRKVWLENNLGKTREQTARRKASKLQRTPSWINNGHLFEIECINKYAACLRKIGLTYEVDHIVPLQGKTVSGMHVPWNMQVIHISENRSKGNKYHG
jgi:5-methylcytosine-specific restriction endonuclease McrA